MARSGVTRHPSIRGARGVAATYFREVRAFPAPARHFLAASILAGINAGVSGVLLALFLRATGAGEGDLGRLLSLGSVGAATGAIAGGPVIDRWGPWRALVGGTIVTGIGLATVLASDGAPSLSAGLLLGGFGAVVVYLAVPPYLVAVVGPTTGPYLFGVAGAAYVASTAAGGLLGGLLPDAIRVITGSGSDATTYRLALGAGAACSALGIPFLLAARTDPEARTAATAPGVSPGGSAVGTSPEASAVSRAVRGVGGFLGAWRDPAVRADTLRFVATDGLLRLGGNMVVPFFSVYFVHELGASESWYGILRVVERAIEVVAMLGVAPLAARFGTVATIAWTQALSVPMLLGLGHAPGLLSASLVFLARGTLMEMTVPLRDSFMMGRLPAGARATGSAAVMVSGYALAFVGVRAGGALNEAGLRHVAYLATAALYLLGAIAFARVFRPGRQSRDLASDSPDRPGNDSGVRPDGL